MEKLDEQYESALRIIIRHSQSLEEEQKFDGNVFPIFMQTELKNILMYLCRMNYITTPKTDVTGISTFYLTKKARLYFDQKEEYIKKYIPDSFQRLSERGRNILALILDSQNAVKTIDELFYKASDKEDNTLRNTFSELREKECVNTEWAESVPYIINVLYKGENYFIDEYESACRNERNMMNTSNSITIGNFNTSGSNVVFGDVINSNFSINNSIEQIQKEIEEKGGEDKEILNDLLLEVKDIISNMEETRKVPKASSFVKRLQDHTVKYGWFYGAITSLLGSALMQILLS